MELAVLVKGVPLSDELRYDPERLVVARDALELVANPFDQRAVGAALDLRGPSDRLTVVGLGPPRVRALLEEARALGADRALHLCAPEFAGSDVLATATVLAAALRRIGSDLVLAGTRSTDSDTGLVGPEVAGLLDVPIVSGARAIRRRGLGERLEVDHDTGSGRASTVVGLPAVITVGEKIGKPRHATEQALLALGRDAVETLGPSDLGLGPAEVGAFASPTRVVSVSDVAPRRLGRSFAEGPVARRVHEALQVLRPLLGPRAPLPPLPWPPAPDAAREVLVLLSGPDGTLAPAAPSRLSVVRRALPAHSVGAVVYGPRPSAEAVALLESAGALAGYLLDPGAPAFDSSDVARGLAVVLGERPKLAAVVTDASSFGREVAGQLAAAHRLGAVGDAVDVRAEPEGTLTWTKPSFGGRTHAAIRCRSSPTVATMPDGLSAPATDARAEGRLVWQPVPVPPPRGRLVRGTEVDEPLAGRSVDGAEVVVAVGSGIGGPDGIGRLAPVLARWDAALVATRRVVDAGWMPARAQLGLTGRLLAPRLAVLLGVRGAPNHMVGWRRAGAILAVNGDPGAPVFAEADAGIVGEIDAVVPELLEPLALALRRPALG